MSSPNDRKRHSHGRRNTDIPEEEVIALQHRMDSVEDDVNDLKEILSSVSESLKQLVLIESNTQRTMKDVGDIKEALHGTQNSKGLFTRLSDVESKSLHHTRLWIYVGGSIGAGIMWGVGQIFYHIWTKATGG